MREPGNPRDGALAVVGRQAALRSAVDCGLAAVVVPAADTDCRDMTVAAAVLRGTTAWNRVSRRVANACISVGGPCFSAQPEFEPLDVLVERERRCVVEVHSVALG